MPDDAPKNIQPRARRTRAKLLAALEQLLQTKEFDQIAMTEIAHEAGVAVGSIYSHFADKDAFLEALLDHWRTRVEARLEAAKATDLEAELRAEGSLRAALHMVVRYNYEQLENEKHIIRAVHHYLRRQIETDQSDWRQIQEEAYETIAIILDVFADEVRRTDKKKSAKMLNYALSAIFTEFTAYNARGLSPALSLEDDALVHEAAEMVYAYLTTPD